MDALANLRKKAGAARGASPERRRSLLIEIGLGEPEDEALESEDETLEPEE